ncbi:MAG TPA: TIGR03435 family protein [Acidobacteriota bacterium]|nr:TIGR03435 family protein [Acidobacteriota bacterium]
MKTFRSLGIAAIFWGVFFIPLFAQTPPKLQFEVATVRPSPPISSLAAQAASGKIDLGMRADATQFDMKFMSLTNLIATAYKVKPYQIDGPDWMKTQLWEIHAKLPEGSTKEQIPEMLQSLLTERFKLTFHRESREQPVYALTVSKSGLKMKEAVAEPATPAPEADAAKSTAPKESGGKEAMTLSTPEGEMKVNMKQQGNTVTVDVGKAGKMQMIMDENPHMRWEMPKATMAEFVEILTQFSDRQVVDMTELKGPYQVVLELPIQELLNMAKKIMPEYAGVLGGGAPGGAAPSSGLAGVGASDPSGGSIFQAVQRLGLKMDPRKINTDTIVVDEVLKEPTEN